MRHTKKTILVSAVVFAFFCTTAWSAQSTIIEGVTLLDGTGRPASKNTSVRIDGSTITQIKRGQFAPQIKAESRVIDGNSKYLIPGLIDVHIHLQGGKEITKEGLVAVATDDAKGIRALHSYLYSGVTSIYDAGNSPKFIFALRDKERSGELVSPRIFAAGGIVTYPGSHGSGAGSTDIDQWPEDIPLLRAHADYAPDMMKLTFEDRGWGARPMIPMLTEELMQNIISYYNDLGIRSTAHVSNERYARQAIFAGVDALAHPVIQGPVTESFVKLMAAKQIPMASTMTIGENYSRLVEKPEFLDEALYRAVLTPDEIELLLTEKSAEYKESTWTWWMKVMTKVVMENIMKINQAGGVIALGTDQTIGPAVHRELELLSAAGISNLDIITIATLNGARFLGRQKQLGSIEEGKLADMVLLNKDPLEDINNLKDIAIVIKNGIEIDRTKLKLPINSSKK
jgi:imidazolonepropionase-like amidohydrolase